jgi:hypothetical protein
VVCATDPYDRILDFLDRSDATGSTAKRRTNDVAGRWGPTLSKNVYVYGHRTWEVGRWHNPEEQNTSSGMYSDGLV